MLPTLMRPLLLTRGVEAALAGFVDDWLPLNGSQLRDDFPARLAPCQHPAAGAGAADAGADGLAPPALVGGQVAAGRAASGQACKVGGWLVGQDA